MADENMLVVRFRVYAPNGEARGVLPHPLSWEAGIPFNDMPSLTMTYPDGSDAANLLKQPCEVALELRNPNTGAFVEHPGCRFLNIRRSLDLASRPRILNFTMPSYGWMLKKVRWLDPDNPRLNKEGQIVYRTAVTPVTPLINMINLAKARQNIPGLEYNFTSNVDSSGTAWGGTVKNLSFDYGQDAWSVLDSLSKQGFFEWRMNGRTLECFKTNTTLRRMLDTDTGVHVHSMLATTEEPVDRTWEELAGTFVAIGDQNVTSGMVTMPDDPANFPWGLWDEAISASGVSDVQVLAQITDNLLATKYKSRTQYTKKFTWTEGAPIPLVDYRPGDFIRAMSDATTGAQKASMRVYQITLSGEDPYGVAISLTLNDRFTDRALQVDRWVSRVTGGGGPVGGGGTGAGGTRPQAPVDSTPPKAPVLTSVTNTPYFSELGEPVSRADVAFQVVTEDINNIEIDVVRYNIAARRSDHNWQQARMVIVSQPDSPSTGQIAHAFASLLDSGHSYEFRVQAIRRSGYTSDWSNAIVQTMDYPVDPLPVPSVPLLSSKLSTVKAEWDGLDANGEFYPAEFREVQVEVSTDNINWVHAGDIFSPGSSLIMSGKGGAPTWSVGDTVYVRFRSRNSASVISQPSAATSITVLGVEGPDIEANSITANEMAVGTLTAEQMRAHSLTVDRLSIGDTGNLIADPQFYETDVLTPYRLSRANSMSPTHVSWSINGPVASLSVNSTGTGSAYFGFYNNDQPAPAINTSSNFPPGRAIPLTRPGNATTGAGTLKCRFRVTTSGTFPSGSSVGVNIASRFYDRNGNSISNLVLASTTTLNSTTDAVIESTSGTLPPVGTVACLPYVFVSFPGTLPVGVTLNFSQFEVWQENSVYIGDGMVRAPLVAADAITTDKLQADAITAKHSIRSAYYEMVSQSGTATAATVKITSNANLAGQSGIRWDGLIPSGGSGPRIFQADTGGSGGWDARGLIITGPEQVTNDTGRIDLVMAYGIAGARLSRSYGVETISQQGIYWDTNAARFRIGGMFNTGHFQNDMFRMGTLSAQSGTYSYGIVTARRYYPLLTAAGGTTPQYASIRDFPDGTNGGFRYHSTASVTSLIFLAMCGTP